MGSIVGANGALVCDFGDGTQYYPTEGTPPEGADGALLLAAPDLLASLREFVALYDGCRDMLGAAVAAKLARAEAVIAKAEGN